MIRDASCFHFNHLIIILSRSFLKEGLLTNTVIFVTWLSGFFCLGPKYLANKFLSWVFSFLLVLQGYLIDKLLDKEKHMEILKGKLVRYIIQKLRNRNLMNNATAGEVPKPNESNCYREQIPM